MIPGVLAMGEAVAGYVADYVVAEYHSTIRGNHQGRNTSRSHSGIYCNPASQKRNLRPIAESQPCHFEPRDSDDVLSQPMSSHRASNYRSERDSRLPTSQPKLPNRSCAQPSKHKLASKYLLSFDSDGQILSNKTSADYKRVLPLTVKNVAIASNSTCGTCSDVDTIGSLSTASFNMSNDSEQWSSSSVCHESVISSKEISDLTDDDIDAIIARGTEATRMLNEKMEKFQVRSQECDLSKLEEQMVGLSKDFKELQANAASSKRRGPLGRCS